MSNTARNYTIEKSGYFFVLFFAIAIAGFWPSYFSKFFDGTADFNFYFHFHAVVAVIWILMLIVQPILINKKKLKVHRVIGTLSYIVVPLIFISVSLLAHHRIDPDDQNLGLSLWIPFKDLLILAVGYGIAIKYRHNMAIHARGMIVSGLVLVEPALIRLLSNTLFASSDGGPVAYLTTIAILYLIIIVMMIAERSQKSGRWVFPLTLGLYIFVHSVIIFQINISPWQSLAAWFASLPLT